MIERHGRGTFYHSAVAHGDTLYLSGCVAEDRSASMKVQTRQTLDKIARVLAAHGSDASKILSATVYITDFAAKDAMNEAWVEWFEPADLPARATIGVATLGEGVLIEVMVTATR
jgi:2-iminobutanoate/2-iminopropanoate deaminase